MGRLLFLLAALGGLFASTAAAAEPFTIDLEIHSGKATKTAHAESAAPKATPAERGVLALKVGDRVTVKWKLRYNDASAVKDVTVHFFAVKEDKVGQRAVPKPKQGLMFAETALSMDFGPKDQNESELTFTLDKPGAYLFRLETIGAALGAPGHEDFAALDVTVR